MMAESAAEDIDAAFWEDVTIFVNAAAQNATLTSVDAGKASANSVLFLSNHGIPTIFNHLFDAIKEDNDEKVQLLTSALTYVFTSDSVVTSSSLVSELFARTTEQHVDVLGLLNHSNEKLARVVGTFVKAVAVKNSSDVSDALFTDDVLHHILNGLRAEDTKVADDVSECIAALCGIMPQPARTAIVPSSPAVSRAISKTRVSHIVNSVVMCITNQKPESLRVDHFTDIDSVFGIRCLALLCRISSQHFDVVDASNAVTVLFQLAMDDSDPLLQLNVFDLVVSVASSADGFKRLLESGLWQSLLQWSGLSEEALTSGFEAAGDTLIGNTALNTVAALYEKAGENLEVLRKTIVHTLFPRIAALCASGNETSVTAHAIQALCTILSVDSVLLAMAAGDASQAISAEADRLNASYNREWMECIVSSAQDTRASVFLGVALIFERMKSAHTNLCMQLYERLTRFGGTDVSTVVLATLRRPIEEMRYVAYRLLAATAALPCAAAVRAVLTAPQMLTYLMDTTTESTKLGKEWKYAVLDAFVRNASLDEAVGDYFASQLRVVASKGPYYVESAPATVAVAVE